MTHFHGTGSLACAILYCLSLLATIISPPRPPLPPHTTACLGIQPHPCIPLPRRSHSLSDLGCHKPSYILPRVTKLRDAGDKAASPGRRTRRITSLAVCLSLIFTPVGSQTVSPASHEGCYIFFFFPSEHCQLV